MRPKSWLKLDAKVSYGDGGVSGCPRQFLAVTNILGMFNVTQSEMGKGNLKHFLHSIGIVTNHLSSFNSLILHNISYTVP